MKKLILLLIVSTILIVQKVSAARFTWTGTTSTNWTVNTNWSPNGVPLTTDTVKIVSRSNNPVLQANTTVKELEFTSGSLNLNTYSLTVSNNSYFYSGTISNGNLIIRGTYSLYNGTTFSCTIDAVVGRTVFSGGTFNNESYFEQTSTSNSNGAGGCVFNAKTTIKKTGASYLYLGLTSADTFNGPIKFVNTATYAIQVGQGTVANFNDSIILESSGGGGVNFGNSTTGGAILASGKKIVIGSGGFSLGVLLLKNFTQQGSTSQNLQLTNNAIVSIIASTFNGAFTIVAPTLVLSTSTFNGVSDFTKSSTSTSQSNGGNTFNAAATFRNTSSNTGAFRLATNERDIFNSDVTFITTNGFISPAFRGVSEFKGNISINSSLVVFNAGTGTLSCTGSNNQTFSGTANYAIGKLLINKPSGSVTLSKPTTLDSSLTLTSGKIISSTTNLLSLKSTCVLNGGNVNSFIEGPLRKTGNTAFKFAVGKGNDYRPVSISSPSVITDAYTAEYFNAGQTLGSSLDTSINYISDCNYYKIDRNNGTSNVNLTYNWLNKQCDVFDIDSTSLARWSGTKWNVLGLMSYTGNDSIGSNSRSSVGEFGYFAFAHKLFPSVNFSYSVDTLIRPYKVVFTNQSRGFKPNTTFLWSYGEIKNGVSATQSLNSKNSTEYSYFSKRNYLGKLEATQNGINYSTHKLIILNPTTQTTVDLSYSPYDPSNSNPYPCLDSTGIKFSTCFTPILLTCKIDSLAQSDSITITFPFAAGFTFSILNPTANLSCVVTNDSVLTISSISTLTVIDSVKILVYVNNCSVLSASRNQFGSIKLNSNINKIEYYKNGLKINTLAGSYPFALTVNRSSIMLETISSLSNFSSKIDNKYSLNEIVDRYYYIKPTEGITDFFIIKAKYEDDIDVLRVDIVNVVDTVETLVDTVYDSINPPILGGSDHEFIFYNPNKRGLPVGYPTDYNKKSYIPIGFCQPINSDTNCTTNYNYLFYNSASQYNKILVRERVRIKSIQDCKYDSIKNDRTNYSIAIICDSINQCSEKASINLNVKGANPKRKIDGYFGYIENDKYNKFTYTSALQVPTAGSQLTTCDGATSNLSATRNIEYAFILKNALPYQGDTTPQESNTIRLKRIRLDLSTQYYEWDGLDTSGSGFDTLYLGKIPVLAKYENLYKGTVDRRIRYTIDLDTVPYNDSILSLVNLNPNYNNSCLTNRINKFSPLDSYKYLPGDSIIGISFKNFRLRDCGNGLNDPMKLKDDSLYNGQYGLLAFLAFNVYYYDMCELTSDTLLSKNAIAHLADQFSQGSFYNSNMTGAANPSDVTPNSTLTVLSFKHHTIPPLDRRPWLIDDMMFCPNRKAYGILSLEFDPSKVGGADSSTGFPSYFVNDSANFIFTVNGASTNFIGIVDTIDSMHWQVNWPDTLPNVLMDNLDVDINFQVNLSCGNSSSWGLDKFTLRLYESCDDSCSDCSILFGSVGTSVLRHCFGGCPDSNFVDTKNFVASRRSFGWASEKEFSMGLPMPTSSDTTNGSANLEGFYPLDIINLSSIGSIGELDTVTSNYGIDSLYKFYFDIRYLTKDLPYITTQGTSHSARPLLIPLNNGNDTIHGIRFNLKKGSGCTSFIVPANQITTSTLLDPKDSTGSITILRLEPNLNFIPTSCTYILKTLLSDNSYDLVLDLNLKVNDLGIRVTPNDYVKDGYYPLHPLFSMFSYTTIDSTLTDTVYHPSCDPYSSNITYYQITPKLYIDKLYGPSFKETFFSLRPNQCQLMFVKGALVFGGLLNSLDFPGEFRPVLEFPQTINFSKSPILVNTDDGRLISYFPNDQNKKINKYLLNNLPLKFDAEGYNDTTFLKGIDKRFNATSLFYSFFNKGCGDNDSLDIDSTNLFIELSDSIGDITFGAYAGEKINLDLFPQNLKYVANGIKDSFTLDFDIDNTYQNILSNPSQPLNFNLTYNKNSIILNGVIAPDAYVYFTGIDSSDGDFNLFTLKNGVKTLLPSFRNPFVPGIKFFQADTLVKNVKKDLILEVQWNNCSFLDTNTRQVGIIAHSGLACRGYGAMQTEQFPSGTSSYSCIEFVSDTINLNIGESILTVSIDSIPNTIEGCGQFNVLTELSSLDADVTNGLLTIQTQPGIVLLPNLSTVNDTSGNPIILGTLATPIFTNIFDVKTWSWSIDSILHHLIPIPVSDIHFNGDVNYGKLNFNLQFSTNGTLPGQLPPSYQLNISASGNDLCGNFINELSQSQYISYINPPNGYVYINQTGTLCNGDSVVLNVLDINVNAISYVWSTGDSTQSIIVTEPGLYTVEVSDSLCTYYALINIYASPASILNATDTILCNGQPVVLTATDSCPSCTFLWNNGATTNQISVGVAGNYVVTITDSLSGCTTIDSVTVINTSLQASINATNNGLICNGITPFNSILTATSSNNSGGPLSYSWYTPFIPNPQDTSTIVAIVGGTYLAVITNSFGCSDLDSIVITNITPNVYFNPSTITYTGGGTPVPLIPIYSNLIGSTYLWSNGNTTSTDTINVSSNSNYTVTVTNTFNGYGCSDTGIVKIIVDSISNRRCFEFPNDLKSADFFNNSVPNKIITGNYNINSDIEVVGFVTVDSNSIYAIAKDISITVKPNATLNIEVGAHLYSCYDDMWDGIIVEPGGALIMYGDSTEPVLIEDAKIAVLASGTASIAAKGNTTFNSNYISVYLHDGSFDDADFTGAKFTCTKFLDRPYNNNANDRFTNTHIKAINAGTINLGIRAGGNEFRDAMYILDFDRTNLNVDDCYFSQRNVPNAFKNMTAVRFFGEVSDPSKSYYLKVGFNSSTKTKNKFEDCKRGIYTKFRTNVAIERNEFYRSLEGILIAYNDRSNVPNRSGTVSITNNDFDYVSGTSISMFQNPKVYSYIHNNRINMFNGFVFDPILESRKGILIRGANLNPIGSNNGVTYVVTNNQIRNCRFGIQLMNQEYGNVSENDVIFDIPDTYLDYSLNVFRAGINLQNTRSVAVNNNYIRRMQTTLNGSMIDPTKTLLCGINVDFSGSNFKQNNTSNIPTHYKISNTCDLSTFECNELDNGLEGFKLEGGTISSQGLLDQPNGNKWINWPIASTGYTRINGNGQPGLRDWFFDQNNPALEDPTDGGSMGLPFNINENGISYPSCTINPCPYCDLERLYMILSNADSLNYTDEQKFALEKFVYRNLKDSLQLMYSGSTYDAALQNFFTSVSLQNVGLLNSIDELLNNNEYATAYLNSISIESDRLVEQNLATVNRICAQYEMDFDYLDESSYQELLAIAYQYPRFGGEAVFRARAILGIDVDDTELALRQSNSDTDASNEVKIKKLTVIPNPTKGLVTVNYPLQEFEIATLQITDQFGRLMFTKVVSYPNTLCNFDLSTNKSGVYYLNLTTSKGEVVNEKIVLIK